MLRIRRRIFPLQSLWLEVLFRRQTRQTIVARGLGQPVMSMEFLLVEGDRHASVVNAETAERNTSGRFRFMPNPKPLDFGGA